MFWLVGITATAWRICAVVGLLAGDFRACTGKTPVFFEMIGFGGDFKTLFGGMAWLLLAVYGAGSAGVAPGEGLNIGFAVGKEPVHE